ncbi:DUF4184 family protein [Pontibacter qinzhouensis]|uniref:DUF4184 family protein n=1 Tax=Pontibacter qinzhouensis TaxID=2603253 RepID=A0A5C8J8R4_9BACT|nr:DUF4184 family protein [Pontibacter qinzhouensis]TXK33822.1 DUF4184 family protein [Pontibacter qinzhouensis]
MPFTFSHPAIVLPVHAVFSRWTSLTGLAVGSMAPDFEKFIRMAAHDPYSHTWRSIFYFNLPMGLLLAFLFHVVVRNALIDNLPGFLRKRLHRYKSFNWVGYFKRNYGIVLVSIVLGAASHIFWDSFTHKEGRAVGWFPVLLDSFVYDGYRYTYFFVLQLLSSLVGLMAIMYAILKLPKKPVAPTPLLDAVTYWLIVFTVTTLVVLLKFILGEHSRWDLVFIYIAGGLVGLIATPLLLSRTFSNYISFGRAKSLE